MDDSTNILIIKEFLIHRVGLNGTRIAFLLPVCLLSRS